jgi:hypothetical protein
LFYPYLWLVDASNYYIAEYTGYNLIFLFNPYLRLVNEAKDNII